jgi:proliferating cell nuclear antigen
VETLEELKQKKKELIEKEQDLSQKIAVAEAEAEKKRQRALEAEALARRVEEDRKERIRKQKLEYMHVELDTKLVRSVFDAIRSLNNECKVSVGKDGWRYIGVDPAHVALIEIEIPASTFRVFLNKAEHDIGIEVEKLYKILKRRALRKKKGTDPPHLIFDQFEEDNDLYISWPSDYGKFKRKLTAIDTAAIPTTTIPHLDMPAHFDVPTKGLTEFLKEADDVSDHISITASPTGIEFLADSNPSHEHESKKSNDDIRYFVNPIHSHIKGTFKSIFSVDYFMDAVRCMNLFFDEVILHLGTDNPVILEGKGAIHMKFMLAPRIEAER